MKKKYTQEEFDAMPVGEYGVKGGIMRFVDMVVDIKMDGNKWCVIEHGKCLADSPAGFGDTPLQAFIEFEIGYKNQEGDKTMNPLDVQFVYTQRQINEMLDNARKEAVLEYDKKVIVAMSMTTPEAREILEWLAVDEKARIEALAEIGK